MQQIFITATGTGMGKTFVTAALARQLRARCEKVIAIKPIITGWDDGENTDTKILMKACGMTDVAACSPWRFTAPLAADMAAASEGRKIDFTEVVAFCNRPFPGTKLIEGAGGVMSPVSAGKTFLDLIKAVGGEVILVTGSYLGSISHTLTALEVLTGLEVRVVINESENSEVPLEETAKSIANFTNAPITILYRCKSWQDAPDLTELL